MGLFKLKPQELPKEARPFKGIHYNYKAIPDVSAVMAPPYDVISPKYQDDLYKRHDHNVVRLILGKINENDSEDNNRYTRAATDLQKWLDEGVLVKEKAPCVYAYHQEFTAPGGKHYVRKGVIALRYVEPFWSGRVYPHERTLSGPKVDRLKLMKATNTNLSQVFAIYDDPKRSVETALESYVKKSPDLEFEFEGIKNSFWAIDKPRVVSKVVDTLSNVDLIIADGHHRYETALSYKNYMEEKQDQANEDAAYNYLMMFFCNMQDEGLCVLPTHRLVHSLATFNPEELLTKLKEKFNIIDLGIVDYDTLTGEMERWGETSQVFGLRMKEDQKAYLLVLNDEHKKTDPLGSLDVTVLHSYILEDILGIDKEAQEKQTNLKYMKDPQEAWKLIGDVSTNALFLMNATKLEQIRRVAADHNVMPQKSTYFYPKILSGLVFHAVGSEDRV